MEKERLEEIKQRERERGGGRKYGSKVQRRKTHQDTRMADQT
jgi:hypothetical protein